MKSNRRGFVKTLAAAGIGASARSDARTAAAQQHLPPVVGGATFQVPALEVRDGKAAIPSAPGWGVTINPDWLSHAKREVSERP